MDAAAEAQEFERAALFRDRVAAIRSLMERQQVAGEQVGTADLVGVAVEAQEANAQVFQVRDGVLTERQGFYLDNKGENDLGEVAEQFIAQYYEASPTVPPLVVVGPELAGRTALLAEALGERRGATVEVRAAERGDKRRLRELAERNARLALDQEKLRRERRRRERSEALAELAEGLGMDEVPIRIEGYDISNLGPEHTVASMVVFEGGAAKKSDYRRFRIRGIDGRSDDFAAMNEVLTRRLARYVEESEKSPHDAELDESFAALPDLVMIDGGKGQLAAGVRALQPLIERGTTVISLAKRLEEVYVPGGSEPLPIRPESNASRLLQRVRDEAHRFALDLHRKRRGKAMTGSVLDGLRGVGPVRKRALLSHFGSPERFLHASAEEIEAVPGDPGQARPRHPPAAQQGRLSAPFIIPARGRSGDQRQGAAQVVRRPSRRCAGLDFRVDEGEVFALLGPNGAGKTTTLEILEGFRSGTAGEVRVLGEDPASAGRAARAGRHRAAGCRMRALPDRPRGAQTNAGYYPSTRARRRGHRARRAGREGRRPGQDAVRRAAAPPRRRARHRRRPGAALPRRADHRVRPDGPPLCLGAGRRPPRARARPSCSPLTTWTRRRRSPTGWR